MCFLSFPFFLGVGVVFDCGQGTVFWRGGGGGRNSSASLGALHSSGATLLDFKLKVGRDATFYAGLEFVHAAFYFIYFLLYFFFLGGGGKLKFEFGCATLFFGRGGGLVRVRGRATFFFSEFKCEPSWRSSSGGGRKNIAPARTRIGT